MTDRTYLRVSFATAESGTIAKQRHQLTPHAAADRVEYVDESVSGSKVAFAERPAGGRLLADLRAGDRVLVTRVDRAARSTRDLLGLVETVENAGATIKFTEQDISTEGAYGKFTLTLLAALAELEAGIISERRTETLAVMKSEGRHAAGGIPVGLRSVPRPTGGRELAVDPDKGPLVADVVARILDGATVASQAPRLGITQSSLSRLLGNRLLAEHGVFTWTQWDALRSRQPGRKAWTATGGIGEAVTCYACDGRLYLTKLRSTNGKPPHYKCGPGKHSGGKTRGVTITETKLHAEVEETFLREYGDLEVIEERTIGDDEERAARVHAARTALEAATAAIRDAEGEAAEDAAYATLRAAKNDLRVAESMPVQTRAVMQPTGETYSDRWADADDAGRVRLLKACGMWVVWPPNKLESGGRVEHEPDPNPVLVDPWART